MDSEDDCDGDWDVLETIQSFDLPDSDFYDPDESPSHGVDFVDGIEPPPCAVAPCYQSSASTPVSLLVESLVQQLCALLEKDCSRSKELYESICEKLEQMQLIDNTWNMGEFDVMRTQYGNALHQLVRVAQGPEMLLPAAAGESKGRIWPLPQPVTMEWSRYHKDFEELSFIAGGGFGKVFRAQNKLDGIVYAVKKVKIKAKSINKVLSHLSEVKTLASLHHANIVPYKTAWLEPYMDSSGSPSESHDDDEDEPDSDDDDEGSSSAQVLQRTETKRVSKTRTTTTTRREEFSDSVVFENSTGEEGSDSVWTHSLQSSSMYCETEDQLSTEEIASNAVCPYETKREPKGAAKELAEIQPHLQLEWAVLYIQMTECQLTLRTWLDDRNGTESFTEFYRNFISSGLERNRSMSSVGDMVDVQRGRVDDPSASHLDVVRDVFLQLINGLYYIHSRNIVHHDIKPSNIFISIDHDSHILVQLGDFGLACPLHKGHVNTVVGTPQYAAPEQLKGLCDKKSDIYSLGVILLELLLCFRTDSERHKTVSDAKKNIFPEEVPQQYRCLLRRLLSEDLKDRPDWFELLEIFNRMCMTHDPLVVDLQKKLSTQGEEIAELRAQVETKQQETVDLHKNLELEVQSRDQELHEKDREIRELKKKLETLTMKDEKTRKQIHAKHQQNKKLKRKLDRCVSTSDTSC